MPDEGRRKEVDAVTSHTELTAAQTLAALKPHLKQGETVARRKVDPSLLGGLTVQIGFSPPAAATKIGAISRAPYALKCTHAPSLSSDGSPLASTRPRDSESRVASMA